MSSLISFSNVLKFCLYKSFTSLVNLIPKYFIPFDAIVFLISFLDHSLLIYGNATDFCVGFVSCYLAEFIY